VNSTSTLQEKATSVLTLLKMLIFVSTDWQIDSNHSTHCCTCAHRLIIYEVRVIKVRHQVSLSLALPLAPTYLSMVSVCNDIVSIGLCRSLIESLVIKAT